MRLIIQLLLLSSLALSTAACAHTQQQTTAFKKFAREMAEKHDFNADQVERLLIGTTFRDDIIEAITRPAESKAWHEYRPIFLNPVRVAGGVEFWRQ
ncbi:MAG: lytic murein transglycosylase B, partial [gamma proteobacterium symbiont of Ctena orbiculata]